jgi:polysaccharide biosynthesis protein PslG
LFFKKKFFVFILFLFLVLGGLISFYTQKQNEKLSVEKYSSIPNSLGVNVNHELTDDQIQSIVDAGFKWVRIDLVWSSVEKEKGQYDFKSTGYDRLNKSLKEKGIRTYFILDYENKLYEKNRSVVTGEGRKAFSKFVKAAVERYSDQESIWEIWNEPNNKNFWNPQPSYKDYSLLVQEVAPVIKKYDKTSTVVAPALAGVDQYSLEWLRNSLDQGILDYIDAISVHPYQYGKPENVIDDYHDLKTLVKKYSKKNVPIISGEWGYSMTDTPVQEPVGEIKQAEYLTRMFLINAEQKIPISIWYNWKNDGTDPQNRQHNFGVVSYYSNPKLSFLATQTLTKQLNGYTFSKKINSSKSNDYTLEFVDSDGKKILAFWTTDSNHNSKIKLTKGKGKLVSMLGAVRNVEWRNSIELNLSTSPSYLVIE